MNAHNYSKMRRRSGWVTLLVIAAMIVSMFPDMVPGSEMPAVQAHNLQTRMVYMFFDPETQACLDARINGTTPPTGCASLPTGWKPGDPLLLQNDKVGVIIKVVPRDGTTTGVGGHIDFYIPNGVEVVDVAYVVPDGAGGFTPVPMKGQSPIAIGDGPIGAKTTAELIGLPTSYTSSASGITAAPVSATGTHRGTIAGVYGDTGIFYSTDPDTAYGSWQRFTGDSTANGCGSLAFNPTALGKTITNNSGDVVVPCNKWDAEQLFAWGAKGTTYSDAGLRGGSLAIVDYPDQRGNAPWGFASGVAGPDSGYAWNFDWDAYKLAGGNPLSADHIQAGMAPEKVGPWKRIRYAGDRVSYDQPGLISAVLGYANKDAGDLGIPVADLPPTTSQTDDTSPKVIRWAVGQLTAWRPEYAWVQVRVNDPTGGITDPSGCPVLRGDTFGGDAGGTDNGKDHLWRYYEPTEVKLNLCVAPGKPANDELVKSGDIFQYPIKIYNLQGFTLTNVVVRDTLGTGITFLSAVPAQNSGPNPLVWNVGTLAPGQRFSALVTVKAASTGFLDNCVTIYSDQMPPQSACDTTVSGLYPYLVPSKTVRSSSVAPGGTVIYDVLVKNIGEGPTGNPVTIREFLPTGFTYDPSYTPVVKVNGATVAGTTVVYTPPTATPSTPIFTVPSSILGNNRLTIAFQAKVDAAAQVGTYCNSYSVTQNGVPITTGSEACVTVAGGKIGDFVWRDWDGDGMQDAGEEGIAGVTVKLYDSTGTNLLATTTTDANGNYYFPGLMAGTYVVEVNNGAPLPGTVQTGDPDSACPGAGCNNRHTVTLTENQQYLTADFGYKPTGTATIGDKVFEDIGNDGLYNEGVDFGIDGVTVWLYEDSNNNGVIDAGDALVATAVSSGGGNYLFSNLASGYNYLVKVDKSDTDIQTYFNGKYDPDPVPYQLSTLEMTRSPNLSGSDLDNDFGFWRTMPAKIGDQVFIDNNHDGIYNSGDAPLAGVTVWLYRDTNGDGVGDTLAATTTSAADGTYLFDNLGPGSYKVVVNTADPDLPGGLFATVTEYSKTLAAGENYLSADFPFVGGLTKTVDKAYAPTGETVTFSLKPYYPGGQLLENVRIFDPLPTGTTYVAGSANAGGTYGAYAPLAGVPGYDPEGGPLGTTGLRSSMMVNTNYVLQGGTVNVTLRITSTVAVNNVSPTELQFSGGAGTCSGPTPASANLLANTGQNFAWSCTLAGAGEYIFWVGAQDTTGGYIWPEASSPSVLSSPGGGPNVVTWNLGSNVPGIPGETIVSGYTAGVYAFRGANTKEFSKYAIASNAWTSKAQPTNGIEKGGSLTVDTATGTIYASEGNSKWFYKYDINTNTWTRLTDSLANFNEGGATQFLTVDGVKYVYALLGNSNLFSRYNVATNNWTALAVTPANVKKGGALTTDGTNLYALQGDRKTGFWRYNITANTWTLLTPTPGNVGWGGSLVRVGNYIYAMQGDGKTGFYRYDIAANTWTAMAPTPGNVADGGALTTDGTYIYALQGKTKAFWRYDIATNTWTTLPSVNFTGNVGQGGALVYAPGVNPQGRYTAMVASPSLVSTGDQIKVRLQLQSNAAVNNVVPGTLNVSATGGASCSTLTGPMLASADDDIVNLSDPVIYEWTCTAAAGTSPGSLTFSAGGTGDGPTTFPTAYSKSVLVSPVLTYKVTVNTGAPAVIKNTGIMAETSGTFGSLPSNTTETATSGSIGDRVWADLDGDGMQDVGELGLAGVKVYVDSNNNGQWDSGEPYDVTDASGLYRIFGLGAGTYNVLTDPSTFPAGYVPTTDQSLSVTLSAGQQYNDADFGLQPPGMGKIGDYVWLDKDSDGVQDTDESGLPGITVKLYRDVNGDGAYTPGLDVYVRSTTTDANGAYLFSGLGDGKYLVQVDTSSTVTSPYGGTYSLASAMYATYDEDSGTTNPNSMTAVTLSAGAREHLTADFGYNWSGRIGDYVWWDNNADGLQNETPATPIAGAAVLLYFDANGNGILDPAMGDYQIGFAMTGADGKYLFSNLPPGKYLVDVYEDSITTNGVRNIVPTTNDVVYKNLGAGETYLGADFGYYRGALVQGNVFHDDDRNELFEGAEQGLAGIVVTLVGTDMYGNPVSKTTTTDANGHFKFIVPEGDYTLSYSTSQTTAMGYPDATTPTTYTFHAYPGEDWHPVFDFGVDYSGKVGDRVWNDANGNLTQDPGELGIPGVTVNLYAADGTTWLGVTVTDEYGMYLFEGLADGTYVIKVDSSTVPTGYQQTYDNWLSPTDHTGRATVSGGMADLSADFGYRYPMSYPISGNVFNDVGIIGTKEAGVDMGLQGITVYLYDASGTTILATATTDANGDYTFPGMPNGSYLVKVDTSTLPSTAYAETYESDASINNAIPVTVNNAPSTGNDFGFHAYLGSISGFVCEGNGNGLCETGEDPLKQVTIILTYAGPDGILGTADDVVTTTTTSGTGYYSFSNLAPGLYQVQEVNPPGWVSLADADGGNPDSISLVLDFGPDGIAGTPDDRLVKVHQDFEDQRAPAAGIISPDPLQIEAQAGTSPYFVQTWTNLGLITDRGNITIYDIPSGWGVTVYRDANLSADPKVGAYTGPVSAYCPSGHCKLVATESNGDGILDNHDTIAAAQDTGSDGIPDSGDLAANGGTVKVILVVTVPSTAMPGTYTFLERGSSNNDWLAKKATNPTLAYNDDSVYHDEARKTITIPGATLGDRVWLDENSDGVQDAGEAGIANVEVTATWYGPDGQPGGGDDIPYTTWTDSEGKYVFTNLPGGNYNVTVDHTTLASGLADNPTYDYDGVGTMHTAAVTLTAGQEFVLADFGYNWAAKTDVDNGTGTGAIGDRIWVDADGDGKQDPGEPGLGGVTVELWGDSNGDGIIDALLASTTTAPDGSYIFDGLLAGIYEVRVTQPAGYSQSGDPDQPGMMCTACDNKTTAPIILAPGDVYVNADFGYWPNAGYGATIGDQVWFDADGDGMQDAGELGIPGVSVALIRDSDGDGMWDAGEPIIATTATDLNGRYLFTGVPITDGTGTDDYLVWVNDTSHVLAALAPTYDADGTATPNISAVTDLTVDGNLAQDFGYAPAGHTTATGLIGDTVFLDRDADHMFDPGEGLEGVTVRLYDATGTVLLATTYTDENGHYYFGGLDPNGTYVVKVDTSTLPNGGVGLTNSVDPDGGIASQSSVSLGGTNIIRLDQDFGYTASTPNSISGTIWKDMDADGFMDASETGWLAGVTVALYDNNGNIVATTTTDALGNYSFSGLPDGTYTVDVTDDNNVLDGYWHSLGTANTDGYSQSDPLTVSLTGGTNVTYADFGYYRDPAVLGNYVWMDMNANGLQDPGLTFIPGVTIILTIEYPNGSTTKVTTVTDATGHYSFGNLLLDEDYAASTSGNPTVDGLPRYTISAVAPADTLTTPVDQGTDDAIDADDPAGVIAMVVQGQFNDTYDFGFHGLGSLGDRIWLDENSDGVQDAGEAGIANVKVVLTFYGGDGILGTADDKVFTTWTDSEGGYLFANLPAGTYDVTVDTNTLASGLAANPTYDYDGIGTMHTATVTLDPSEEFAAADFGYNWAATTDVNNGTGTGAIGDRIWVDADGDGKQDPGEPGLGGVTVELWGDSNGDGIIDALLASTTTAPDGSYIFDGLLAGIYEVRVTPPTNYTLTGDPDQPGMPCTVCDGKTTAPILLAPGDVYVNADFGYKPAASSTIGDQIYLDVDGDGMYDMGTDLGIAGVTVALLDGNGKVVATTATDASGHYEFTGVPAGTYTVWVNDTAGVLGGLYQSGDPDALKDGRHTLTVDGSSPYLDNDFGYVPEGYKTNKGLIGDTIFLDRDGDDMPDPGEGLEGVTVWLYGDTNSDGNYDEGEPLVATAVTNENGQYYFTNLNAGDYVVRVDTSSLPPGLTNTYDPDTSDSPSNESGVTLGGAQPMVNLDQDFGYRGTNSVSGTIWTDTNADGYLDGTETGWLAGVTVVLRDSDGNIVATTTTDANGNYTFSYLPNGTYTVDVTDRYNVLDGYWHSLGTENTDGHSQSDPLTVILSGNTNITYADFGYYRAPAAVGNFVWSDENYNGIQDSGEMGIAGVEVTLVIAYPNGSIAVIKTTTDADGYYSFGNLLLDEDYRASTSGNPVTDGLPRYVISVQTPVGYQVGLVNQGPDDTIDADDPAGVIAMVIQGGLDQTYDFGFEPIPTLVSVSDFRAYKHGNRAVVEWSTTSEARTVGFYLLRLDEQTGHYVRVNDELLPSAGVEQGGTYRLVDEGATPGGTYTYLLEEVEVEGQTLTYGPYQVEATGNGEPVTGKREVKARKVSPEKEARINARQVELAQAAATRDTRIGAVLKLVITQPGLYYVSASEIAALAGISLEDAQAWIANGLDLQNRGASVPYLRAEDKAGIYFYGQGIDSIYTDENVYWIRQGDALPMQQVSGKAPKPVSTTQTFIDTLHLEQDLSAAPALFSDPQADYWMWSLLWAGSTDSDTWSYMLRAPDAAPSATTLTLHLLGSLDTAANPDHHVVVRLNGQQVGEGRWDGIAPFDLVIEGVLLNNGDNTVEVKAVLDAGVPYSAFYVDSLDVAYPRYYRAVGNQLLLRGDGNTVVTVEGFTVKNIWLFDVTNPARPRRIDATMVTRATGNTYALTFAPAAPDAVYLAVPRQAASAPLRMFADVPSDLRNAANTANYVVITTLELKAAAQALADYRRSKGLTAMVVDLEDIYDEFNYGLASPEAIRSFLSHAYHNWSQRPQYVVLAGEGTYDYKDHLAKGDNVIPVWMVSTPEGLYAADNRFADVLGDDGVPEMAIGRLPVMTAAELSALISKIMSYEADSGAGWANEVIMLADNADKAGDFPATSDHVAALVQPSYMVTKIYLGPYTPTNAKTALKNTINDGALWFNYVGHGSIVRLADEKLLQASDVATLNNGNKLPVTSLMTCAAGHFAMPGFDAIGESLLLKTGGGSAAVWAPTGWSLNSEAELLDKALFRAVFQNGEKVLGRAVLSALQEYAALGQYRYHLDIYNLLGDPATEVK